MSNPYESPPHSPQSPHQPVQSPPMNPHTMPANAMINRDAEHLKLLSIFWYVSAGLNALGGCFSLIYVGMGALIMAAPPSSGANAASQPSPAMMGGIFIVIGGCVFAFTLGLAALAFYTGRGLATQRRRTFCMVVAGLTCLSIPLGTILGVFTLMVLSRPTVADMFARNEMRR